MEGHLIRKFFKILSLTKGEIILPKKYWVRLIIGSVLFGVLTFGPEVYNEGLWEWKNLWFILYGTVMFGVLFHLLFSFIIKNTTKKK